jgi:hypothetical protein
MSLFEDYQTIKKSCLKKSSSEDDLEDKIRMECDKIRFPLDLFLKSENLRKYSWDDLKFFINKSGCQKTNLFFENFKKEFEGCPASTKYHNSYFGGLLDHTVDVCKKATDIAHVFQYKQILSVVKCALLHDIGKLGGSKPMYLLNDDFSKHDKEPFVYNNNLVQMPHEIYSLYLINMCGIHLGEDEYQAIAFHNGYYKEGAMQDLRGKECPLTLILHTADNLVSKIVEK